LILTELDNLITARWQRIKYNGAPITVYPFLPDRDKGETKYPCVGFQRIIGGALISRDRRNQQIFIPSIENNTIQADRLMGGGTVEGPVSYTMKPYPTPTSATYEFHALATDKEMADLMIQFMYQAVPPDFCPTVADVLEINGVERTVYQKPVFIHDHPVNMNHLDKPKFRTMFLYHVAPIWIDRLEEFEVAPVEDMRIAFESLAWRNSP
jgi:hypothetical protein